MAVNSKTIQVPVEIQANIKNQKNLMDDLYKSLNEKASHLQVGSSLEKSVQKALNRIRQKLITSEALLGKEFFSDADLNKTVNALGAVSDIISEISVAVKTTSSYKALGLDTTELDNATKKVKELATETKNLKSVKLGSLSEAKGGLTADARQKAQGVKGFSYNKSYVENINSLTASVGKLEDELAAANEEFENLAKTSRGMATQKVAETVKGLGYGKKTKAEQSQAYQDLLDQYVGANGQWKSGGKDSAKVIAGWLGLENIDFSGKAKDIVSQLKAKIAEEMASTKDGGKSRFSDSLWANAQKYLKGSEVDKQAVAGLTPTGYWSEEHKKANEAELKSIQDEINRTNELLEVLSRLKAAYEAQIEAQQKGKADAAQVQVDEAQKKLKQQAGQVAEGVGTDAKKGESIYTDAAKTQGALRDAQAAKAEADARQKQLQQEADQFSAQLKQSVNRWMSAQQIVNIIKNGIRQAVQDIKGLDSAMSNIAVVTDMSISDLWGKINDYMAIAQQYGVTTQGVYEVSQLYYQQGLATAEVMELTTETLKLARVANMDYKDSADAMTVALRGFKMEMSEAATVTDVYSKVAAVTASDQAELAIAMSKTASSAASVGSSFENTTAMLAVMVETTRESA